MLQSKIWVLLLNDQSISATVKTIFKVLSNIRIPILASGDKLYYCWNKIVSNEIFYFVPIILKMFSFWLWLGYETCIWYL